MIKDNDITVRAADSGDASFIADAVMMAVGDEICMMSAGDDASRLPLVHRTFQRLAELPDSQYSYRNTLIAVDADGNRAGAIISYDGASMHVLRRHFATIANEELGWEVREEDLDDETDAGEIYVDTLAVMPQYRKRGIGARLLRAAVARHATVGKPVGLLVEYENHNAQRLYESVGFRRVGHRPFLGVMMYHMQHD